jgi:hypothetical protein
MGPDLEPRYLGRRNASPLCLLGRGHPDTKLTWTKCPELGISGWDRDSGDASHLRSLSIHRYATSCYEISRSPEDDRRDICAALRRVHHDCHPRAGRGAVALGHPHHRQALTCSARSRGSGRSHNHHVCPRRTPRGHLRSIMLSASGSSPAGPGAATEYAGRAAGHAAGDPGDPAGDGAGGYGRVGVGQDDALAGGQAAGDLGVDGAD